ncbi:MAG: hypothetical protein HIU89_04080 [Proteobacteria bacterium]|nr:hypothetical protein [Pseudomonadota bacterium]
MNTRTWAIAIAFGFGHTLQTVKTNRQRPIHRSVLQQLLDKLTSPRGVKPPATAPAVWGSQRESGLAQEHARFGAMTFHDLRNTQAGVSVKRLSHEFSPCQEFA